MSKKRTDLLIIDPQIDFCRPGQDENDPKRGALYVDNAENDMVRVSDLIKRYGEKIKKIHVTLDCHHRFDIAHPGFWRNSDGKHPDFFTIISHQDVVDAVWSPVFMKLPGHPDESAVEYLKRYTKTLEDGKRYPLCIWPPHCLIGSEGNAVFPVLFEALRIWEEEKRNNNVEFVSKGSTITTEHYSAIKAEVPDPEDPTTQINTRFIKALKDADEVLICGEAGSHCVKNTVEDIADGFNDDEAIKKMVLLTDGISPVQSPVVDFPAIQTQFITDMKNRNMRTAETTDF